jgi:hypothetical protein
MTSHTSSEPTSLSDSHVTIRTDSESYSQPESQQTESPSPPSSHNAPVILYQPPTVWSILRGAAINLFLPFVNGLMLGFGELFAHEAAFRLGWSRTKVCAVSCTARVSFAWAIYVAARFISFSSQMTCPDCLVQY